MAEFQTWDRTVLERFAAEASDRLREQRAQLTDTLTEQARLHAEIAALRADLKAALGAYRREVTAAAPPRLSTTANLHKCDQRGGMRGKAAVLPGSLRAFSSLQCEAAIGAGGAEQHLSIRGHCSVDCKHNVTYSNVCA